MRRYFAWAAVIWLAVAGAAFAAEPAKQPGMLGVQMRDVTKEEADKLGFEQPTGVWVDKPVEGGAAEKAGIQAGDVILLVDGVEIEGATKFREVIGAKGAGAEVKFRVLRLGRSRTVTATLAARPVEAAAPPPPPPSPLQLMIDSGGHTAQIKGLEFTPDGRFIISAGDDKVIRVWDWREGKTVRTIRGETGAGSEGKIYALALSPDGTTLAVGGDIGDRIAHIATIRLYDVASGTLTGVLKGHTNVVDGLAFSPDGQRLISGSSDNTAIIWDVPRRSRLHRLEGHTDGIYAVGFTTDPRTKPEGRLLAVTGSFDTTLRLWRVGDPGSGSGADFSLIAEMKGHTDRVLTLAVNPRDGSIASGDQSGVIRLWDGATGKPQRVLANQIKAVGALRFSPDSAKLLSTCRQNCNGNYESHLFDVASGKKLVTYTGHDNIVVAASMSPDGRFAATGGGNNQEIRVWELATGKLVAGLDGKPTILGGKGRPGWATGFSTDGTRIAWGGSSDYKGHNNRGPLEFQLRLPRSPGEMLGEPERLAATVIAKDPGDNTIWRRAEAAQGSLSLAHRKGGNYGLNALLDISRDGKVVGTIERGATDGFEHSAYSFTPDSQTSVSGGGTGEITAYDLAGKPLGDFVGHEGNVWAVTTSANGRYLVSGSDDQTVRLWNLKTRELLMTLFRGTDSQWIAWTPQGYYTGSPGADSLIGWQLNKGPDQTPAYFSADQLRRQFNRPDIVSKAIVLASAEEAVRTSEGTSFTLNDLIKRPPPRVAITSPAVDATLSGGETVVTIRIEPTPDPVRKLTVRVNGRTIHEQAVGSAASDIAVKVPLAKGTDTITVIAGNEVGDTTAEVRVTHAGEGRLDQRGVLYVVAVGVDTYANLNICGDDKKSSCDLRFAGADASSFADTIKRTLGSQHAKADVQLLTGTAATKPTANNIRDALQRVRNLATETDTVLVFTAGHGVNDGADYLFLTADATKEGRGWRGSTVLKWTELESVIFGAHGARFLFVDTCHSSGAYNAKLGNEAFHNDVTAFTATGPEELALEFSELKHGLFTYAIAEGLGTRAKDAANGTKEVRASTLAAYLAKRTSALIDQYSPDYVAIEKRPKPVPRMFRARDAADHVLARVE